MCGNVGVISTEHNIQLSICLSRFFKQAIQVDALRGMDGTGIASVNKDGKLRIIKKGVSSQEFLSDEEVGRTISDTSNLILCGHNRAATTGSLDDEGAHPFTHGNITLFHNGTLHYWSYLSNKKIFDIDSEAICHSISEVGAKETLEKLEGAYALVWYDSLNATINFARNKERPLYFGAIKDSTSFVYASEKGMIDWLADRNSIGIDKVNSLSVGKILSIPLTENKDNTPTITDFKVKEISAWQNYHLSYQHSGYRDTGSKNYYQNSTYVYTHMLQCIISVRFSTFVPYNNVNPMQSDYGYLKGSYRDCLGNIIEVRLGGKILKDLEHLIDKDSIVRIISVTQNEYIYSVLIKEDRLPHLDMGKQRAFTDNTVRKALDKRTMLSNDKPKEDRIVGPRGSIISNDVFDKLTEKGCALCSCNLYEDDQSNIIWVNQNDPMCRDCAETVYL